MKISSTIAEGMLNLHILK